MSRSIIMKTINEVSDLLDKEEGITHSNNVIEPKQEVYGAGRRKAAVPVIGMGLQAYPVPFGGCSDMYGGRKRKDGMPNNLTSEGRVREKSRLLQILGFNS